MKSSISKLSLLLSTGALVLMLGVIGTAGCKRKVVETPPPPVPTPTPMPAGSLVFIQRGHLVRFDIESSQLTPLTSGKSSEWFPACSPKGDQVAYWTNAVDPANGGKGDTGSYNLWKMNLDGTNRSQITFMEDSSLQTSDMNLLVNDAPAWTSDGKKIIYTLSGDLWEMDSDGYNPETLLNGHGALCPAVSPDGKTVAFISNSGDSVYNLWALNLGDRTVKKVTNYTDWNVGSPSYSVDGRKILINLYKENTTQVYTISASDGGDSLNLTNNNRSLCPRFTQNDRKIVYSAYGTGEDAGLSLYIMNANGTDAKDLAVEGASSPSWFPARAFVAAPFPTPVGK